MVTVKSLLIQKNLAKGKKSVTVKDKPDSVDIKKLEFKYFITFIVAVDCV